MPGCTCTEVYTFDNNEVGEYCEAIAASLQALMIAILDGVRNGEHPIMKKSVIVKLKDIGYVAKSVRKNGKVRKAYIFTIDGFQDTMRTYLKDDTYTIIEELELLICKFERPSMYIRSIFWTNRGCSLAGRYATLYLTARLYTFNGVERFLD